jgi:hypothetical protein
MYVFANSRNKKIMKKYMFGFAIVAILFGCDTKEKEALKSKVDSLNTQLMASKRVEESMNEVGILIDSIEASRNKLHVNMIEGSSYADYVSRLKDINTYVRRTEAKLDSIVKTSKSSSAANKRAIRGYKADLAKQSAQILDLQLRLAQEQDQGMKLWAKINEKDSLLSMKDQVIKMKESDFASLEKLFNDTQSENKKVVSNLYYAQAQALETAANRTQFKPRKKKETRREALELYKLSLSLGNIEAQKKIDELEKKLN